MHDFLISENSSKEGLTSDSVESTMITEFTRCKMSIMTKTLLIQAMHETLKTWGKTPEQICNGDCWRFATAIIKTLGGETSQSRIRSITQLGSQSHTWIEFNSNHFDPESPEGVEHPSQLLFFSRNPEVVISQ